MQHKGFTLIELLVVIAIIAILSVVVILVLNPAQLLKQARDAQRLADMTTLKTAIAVYLSDVSSTSMGNVNICYGSSSNTSSSAGCGGWMVSTDTTVVTSTSAASTTGSGWIPINFAAISSGSPLGNIPVDPLNNATYYYTYATNGLPNFNFELNANMESTKYMNGGGSDVESTDGGSNADIYETGTLLVL